MIGGEVLRFAQSNGVVCFGGMQLNGDAVRGG